MSLFSLSFPLLLDRSVPRPWWPSSRGTVFSKTRPFATFCSLSHHITVTTIATMKSSISSALALLLLIQATAKCSVSSFILNPSNLAHSKESPTAFRSPSVVSMVAFSPEDGKDKSVGGKTTPGSVNEFNVKTVATTDDDDTKSKSKEISMSGLVSLLQAGAITMVAIGVAYTVVSALLTGAADFVSSGLSALGTEAIKETGHVVGAVGSAAVEGAKVAAPVVGKAVVGGVKAAAPVVQSASQKAVEAASPYVEQAARQATEAASPYVDTVTSAVDANIVAPITRSVGEVVAPVTTAVDSTLNGVSDSVRNTLNVDLF